MPDETVRYEEVGAVRVLTLTRPEKKNALTVETVARLRKYLEVCEDDAGCHCIVLASTGDTFCAGMDLRAYLESLDRASRGEEHERLRFSRMLAAMVSSIVRHPKPVVTVIQGQAVGGGFSLAMTGDIRIAEQGASFAAPFVKLGLSGGDMGLSFLLPRAVGFSAAAEILLTGKVVGSSEAERRGIVSRVVPDGQGLEHAMGLAEMIAANDGLAVELTKSLLISAANGLGFEEMLELEHRSQALTSGTEAFRNTLKRFLPE